MRIPPVLLALLLSLPAGASVAAPCDVVPALGLTAADENRLGQLLESRRTGVAAAALAGDEARGLMADFYESGIDFAATVPPGSYQCRTVKLGGPFGDFVAYGWFSCTISAQGDGYSIIKTSGSQRFVGDLIDVDGGLVFRGASFYGDEAPGNYGQLAEKNEVGCLSRKSPDGNTYLLEFPAPLLESDHDVIELRPAG